MEFNFRERREFFDSDALLRGVRLTCPCCGYPMLSRSAAYEICRLCNWEDDGQDSHNAEEVWGGPNRSYSLIEARQNFEQYLVIFPPEDDPRIGGPDSERRREIKRAMIATFDKMIKGASLDELQALWQIIFEREKELELELNRRITTYSSNLRLG